MRHQQSSSRFTHRVLRQVLEQAADPKSVFTLHVSDAPNEKVIYFAGGGIRLLSCGDRSCGDVTSELLQNKTLDVQSLHEVLEFSRKNRKSIKDIVTEKKLLTRDEFSSIVNDLIRREFFDLVFWEDAFYSCYEGTPPKALYDTDKALVGSPNLSKLEDDIGDWIELWDKCRPKIHSDRSTIRTTSKGTFRLEKAEGVMRTTLEHCLNGIDLRSLWIVTREPLSDLAEAVLECKRTGCVEVHAPQPESNSDDDLRSRISALEDGLERVIGKDLLREKLVALYRKADMNDKAVAELGSLAESALRDAQWPVAVDRFKKILDLEPSNLDVLERVMKIYLDQRLEKEALAFAQTHVDDLIARKMMDDARAAGKVIRRLGGKSADSRCIFASITASGGDVEGAVAEYLAIARDLAGSGSKNEARRVLESGLRLCPEHSELESLLCDIDPSYAAALKKKKSGDKGKKIKDDSAAPAPALIATFVVLVVIAGLQLTGIFSIGEAFAKVMSSAMEPAELPEREKDGGINLRIPEGAVTEVVGGVEIPVEGKEGLDARETFGSGRIDLGGSSDADSSSSRSSNSSSGSRHNSETSVGGSNSFQNSYRSVSDGSGPIMPDLAPPRSRDAIVPGQAPRLAPPRDATRASNARRVPSADTSRPSLFPRKSNELSLNTNSAHDFGSSTDKVRYVGGLPLREFQSEADWIGSGHKISAEIRERASANVSHGRDMKVTTRLVDRKLLIAYADSAPLVGANPNTGGRLFSFPGRSGFRWAVGHRAERICRWRVGFQPLVYRPLNPTPRRISWAVPAGTEAMAIDYERVAIRVGAKTFLYSVQGSPIHGSELVAWHEGHFVDDMLILVRNYADAEGSAGTWVIDANSWLPLWCSTQTNNGLEVR